MRLPRKRQFDAKRPPWLHCVSRCVRRLFLCGDERAYRREWLEQRLLSLAGLYAVDLAAYAVMSNHVHVVLRPRPQRAAGWSPVEVVRRWWSVTQMTAAGEMSDEPVPEGLLAILQADTAFVDRWRERFASVSWFMKAWKEQLARAANAEEECTGAFWEGRFHCQPLLDSAAVLACIAYVELNPLRAGEVERPEQAPYCSLSRRLHSPPPCLLSHAELGRDIDQRYDPNDYLHLLDRSARCLRKGKVGQSPADLPPILQRLGLDQLDSWNDFIGTGGKLRGSALGSMIAMRDEARRRGLRWLQQRGPEWRPG